MFLATSKSRKHRYSAGPHGKLCTILIKKAGHDTHSATVIGVIKL